MSGRFPILGAFVITNGGLLLDAGLIERVKGKARVERLQSTGVGRTPEQLGLLFTLFYLHGDSKTTIRERNKHAKYLIWPNDSGRGELKSDSFPGLIRYIRRYFPDKRTRADDYIFDGKEFNKLFHVRRYKYKDAGIVQTGAIDPSNVFLLEVSPEKLLEVYELLRAFDTKRLEKYRLKGSKAENLVELFRITIKSLPKSAFFGYETLVEEGQIPDICKLRGTVSPVDFRESISKLLEEVLIVEGVLAPDDWSRVLLKLKKEVLDKILLKLPQLTRNEEVSRMLYEALSNSIPDTPKVELLMSLYHRHFGDLNMALARCAKYCQRCERDGVGWFFLGKIMLSLKQYEQARDSFHKAFVFGQKVAACLGIAVSYREYDEKLLALEWVEKGLAHDPTNKAALMLKARWLRVYGNATQAIDILDNVLKTDPSYWTARRERVSCLYSTGRSEEVVSEAKRLIDEKGGPLGWVRYLLAASLYNLSDGDYRESRSACMMALDNAQDERERGYIHIILRMIAAKEGKCREAVRQSIYICRLLPERQTAWLQLADDLDKVSHPGLAERFWLREIELSNLGGYELVKATVLYVGSNRWGKAIKCAYMLKSHDDICILFRRLTGQKKVELCLRIHALFLTRLSGLNPGSWQEPHEFIKRCTQADPEYDAWRFLYIAEITEMVRQVDEESFPDWQKKWETVCFDDSKALMRCVIVWRLYSTWSKGKRFARVADLVWKSGWEAVGEAIYWVSSGLEAFAICSALSGLVGFGKEIDMRSQISRFRDWLGGLAAERNKAVCRYGLSYFMIQLLKFGHLEAASSLLPAIVELLKQSKEIESQRGLAYAASLGCLSISALSSSDYLILQENEDLEGIIASLKGKRQNIESFVAALLNCHIARLINVCRQHKEDDSLARSEIEHTLGMLEGWTAKSAGEKEHRTCIYLGAAAQICTNAFHDKLAKELLELLDQRFGCSDELARLVAFLKRRVRDAKKERPATVALFVRPEDELERELQHTIDELMMIPSMSVEVDQDCKDLFQRFMGDLLTEVWQ